MSDDLAALISDLEKASNLTGSDVRPVVAKGALNIKKATRTRWSGLAHAPRLPYAVTYDTWLTPNGARLARRTCCCCAWRSSCR